MSRVVWRRVSVVLLIMTVAVEHKQAANVGGGGMNEVKIETTTEEVTTSRGLLVSGGPVNFTVQSGTKVTLHCRVELQDENASVSWLKRKGDTLQLLSVNMDVFKEDPRFRINFIKPIDWQLYIQPVNYTDQGYYECQVSSHPPIVHSVYLHVVESKAYRSANEFAQALIQTTEAPMTTTSNYCCDEQSTTDSTSEATEEKQEENYETTDDKQNERILSKPEDDDTRPSIPELEIADERNITIKNKFYNSGSTIELRCRIVKVPHPTQFIIWKHNSTILNYDTTRGGISVKTDILPDGARSVLFIANVGPTDSGNYTCSLGEETVTWVSVVVITGESPAAMQHGSATMSANLGLLTVLSAVLSALS